jgi:hypothetical protein
VKAAKEALSRHPQTEVPMPEPFTDVLVTRAELEALVRPCFAVSSCSPGRSVRPACRRTASPASTSLVDPAGCRW